MSNFIEIIMLMLYKTNAYSTLTVAQLHDLLDKLDNIPFLIYGDVKKQISKYKFRILFELYDRYLSANSKNPSDIVNFINLTEKHLIDHKKIFIKYADYYKMINKIFIHCYNFNNNNIYSKYNSDIINEEMLVNKFIFKYKFTNYIKQIKIINQQYWKSNIGGLNLRKNIFVNDFLNFCLADKQENLKFYIQNNCYLISV